MDSLQVLQTVANLITHPVDTAAYTLAAFQVVQLVARVTPTPKDDKIVGKIGKVLNFIFLKNNLKKN